MQTMSTQAKHRSILTAPIPGNGAAGRVCCQAAEALAGDCRLGFAERLSLVERDCAFGLKCSRGCAETCAPEVGFAGDAEVVIGRVGPILAADNERSMNEP
jgi:hypothetical protein